MLIAQSRAGLVNAQFAQPGEEYLCPACRHPVQYRRGKVKIAHFAHLPGANCTVSEGETTEHLAGKQQLLEWLSALGEVPQLEVYLPAINQRPDLLLKRSRIAVEFQCSPLTEQRLRERNTGYRQLGIRPIWILGRPYRHRLSKAKVAQFTQYFQGKPTLWHWDTTRHQLTRWQDHYRCSFTTTTANRATIIKQQTDHLLRQPPKDRTVFKALVADCGQQVPAHCPLVCHDTVPSWPLTSTPLIYWRIIVVAKLNHQPLFTSWSPLGWQRWLIACGQPFWLTFACIELPVQLVTYQFSAELVAAGVIGRINGRVVLLFHPRWFTNLSEKFKCLADYNLPGA